MIRKTRVFIIVAMAASIVVSCAQRTVEETTEEKTKETTEECDYSKMSVEEQLECMRCDTAWIRTLDSLASIYIGPGARCLDAVKHTFRWKGRLWVYNQDWGGVVELPEGFVPEDDRWQARFSYHGSEVYSADSLVYISFYAGYQPSTYEEFKQNCLETVISDSLLTELVFWEEKLRFHDGTESPVIVLRTINADGIRGYFRHIYKNPESTKFSISLQYPAESEEKCRHIRTMIEKYPFGPNGQEPRLEL